MDAVGSTLAALLTDFCECVGLPTAGVVEQRMVHVQGYDVRFEAYDDDEGHFQLSFLFGTTTPGRALVVFRLMLEANVLVYAKDAAQMGMDPDTGGVLLMMRVPFERASGSWLADQLAHYAEHATYWRENILKSTDEMFIGILTGDYVWLRA
jgi:hypothetical protein